MAYSLKPTQKMVIERVIWFIKQKDAYNALEALKDVNEGPWRQALDGNIRRLKSDYRRIA